MSELDNNRRKHDVLRNMVERACEGLLEPIQERIKKAARKAYFLGCKDGMELAYERMKEPRKFWLMGREYDLSKGDDVKKICDVIADCQDRCAPNDLSMIASTLLTQALEARHV